MQIDDFFFNSQFERLNDFARNQYYGNIENPADGVTYPGINPNVPEWAVSYIEDRLSKIARKKMTADTIFFRLTDKNTPRAPHQAHTDSAMAEYTFILFMQDAPPEQKETAGTSLVKHRLTGMDRTPDNEADRQIWEHDTNRYDMWTIEKLYKMRRNRAAFYPSELMHRAEPVGGFGQDEQDGRVVLVAFLNPQ